MNARTRLPFELPDVALSSLDLGADGSRIDCLAPADRWFFQGKLKPSTPAWLRAELEGWANIQRERARLGLPYLTGASLPTIRLYDHDITPPS